jgi:hypothetical protein
VVMFVVGFILPFGMSSRITPIVQF